MQKTTQEIATNAGGTVILTTIGVVNGPTFFHFDSFPQLVATIARCVVIVWGVRTIRRFVYSSNTNYAIKKKN